MKLNRILFIAALVFSTTANAQLFQQQAEKDDLIAKLPFDKKKRHAEGLFRLGSWDNAGKYFSQLKKEQPRNPYLAMMLAECARQQRDYPPAAKYYREAYELAPALYPVAPIREAEMHKSNGNYDEAKARLEFFIKEYKGKDKKLKLYAKRLMDGCDMAKASIASPEPVYVKNAGPNVNTVTTEASPVPLGDTALLFSSMNVNSFIDVKQAKRESYVSRFLWSPKEYDRTNVKDSFEVSMQFNDGKFNDPKFFISNGSWSPGRDRFYFTKCVVNDSSKTKCWINVSNWDTLRGIWGVPKELDAFINDPQSDNTNPVVCMVGKKEVLFFSSNRKSQSAGGYDIWYSVYDPKQKTYRRPQNCGKRINTNKDEVTPWYDSKKGTLYFSSNGLVSMGGYDIFAAKGGPTRYSEVKNLGVPYNSPADDLAYTEDKNEKANAYLVSNRLGSLFLKNPTCCDDIWRVIKTPDLAVKGNVYDEKTGDLLTNVVVRLTDAGSNKVVDTFFSAAGNFKFNTAMGKNYVISADRNEYISSATDYSTMDITPINPDQTEEKDIFMRKVEKNDDVITVSNVFYDFDLGRFQEGSLKALDSLAAFMNANPAISVEVYSNTDGSGDDKYNDELSVRRAEEVIKYLSDKGLDKARMTPRPMGKRNRVHNDDVVDGKRDFDKSAMNRRTYFRIVGEVPGKRIQYENNRPEYIDKSGRGDRDKNLQVEQNDDVDQGAVPAELQK
jgi:OmpA-OmpF porin, OOP family